jgi:RNA polymerase sigma-70 factor, ECF subfamily
MKKKNSEIFLNIYNEHVDGVFRFCFYKTSDRDTALDITQEVFSKIWEYMKKGGKLDNVKAFVYSTANRKIIDWYRTKKVSISLDSLSEAGFEFKGESRDHAVKLDGEKALLLLKDMDDIYREVLLLRFVEELSVREIAEVLGETENNISVRIHRGMEKLRKIYSEEEKQITEKSNN